jgi:hypothetical protein
MLDPSLQRSSKIPPEEQEPNVAAGRAETPLRVTLPAGAGVWTPAKRILFRFVATYVVLYFFPVPEDFLPGMRWLIAAWGKLFLSATPWVCRTVIGVSCEVPFTVYANGDTAGDYAALLLVAGTTVVITTIWSLADRRAAAYPRLYAAFRVYVRFVLAFLMLFYGVVKLLQGQFGPISLHELVTPLGELDPMSLMWVFMGYSKSYTFFAGALETLSGVLLYFRRTTLLGASLAMAVMTNVVVMDFSYHVFVRLFSMHLLFLAIVLVAPDAGRLFDFFVRHRPTTPADEWRAFPPRFDKVALGAKVFVAGWAFWHSTSSAVEQVRIWGDDAPKHLLFGIYDVESFDANGESVPALTTDGQRWRRLIIEAQGRASVIKMNDARRGITCDTQRKTCTLTEVGGVKIEFTYDQPEGDRLVMQGKVGDDALVVHLKRVDESSFPLLRKKFRWINP